MPRMQFSTILSHVESLSKVTSEDTLIKHAIQMGLDRLTDHDLAYLDTEGVLTTVAPYEDGTVTATNGSTTITGASTTFTAAMVGRKIRISSQNEWYRISAFVSTTELTLEYAYQGSTSSGASYSIYKDEYRLAADVDSFKVFRQLEDNIALWGMNGTAFDLLEPAPQSEGGPTVNILAGSKLDTYTTGTVSITVNTSTLTGSSTAWTSVEGLGRGTRLVIGTNVYTVKSVDSATQITIYEKASATVSSITYTAHLDNLLIQLYPIPSDARNIHYKYQRLPFPLINDEDIPDLPEKYHHILVTAGLIWAWMTKDKEESARQELMFQSKAQLFWKSQGHPSLSIIHPRMSQDDIYYVPRSVRYPSGYGIPISQ